MKVMGLAVACAVAAGALGISACSPGGSSGAGGTICHLYTAGQADDDGRTFDVQVATQGGQSCASWLASLASEGLNWSNGTDPSFDSTDPENPNTAYDGSWTAFNRNCELSKGGGILTVFSDGDTPSGTQICSQYESSGWTPYTPTKTEAQAGASAAAAQASAQARAVAGQQASQAAAGAAQTLPGYISTLESDTSSLTSTASGEMTAGAISQISQDATKVKEDLQAEEGDYQGEQENYRSNCTNGPVGSVASMVQGDAGQVNLDLQALQSDIDASQHSVVNPNFVGVGVVEQDISNVNSDVAALRKVGQTPSQDPSQAIAAAGRAINAANSAAAQASQEGNTIEAQAQQISSEAQELASKVNC